MEVLTEKKTKVVKKRALIEILFEALFVRELVELSAFNAWANNDGNEDSSVPVMAIVQTTNFFLMLNAEPEDEEDEEEEEEIDAPMRTI